MCQDMFNVLQQQIAQLQQGMQLQQQINHAMRDQIHQLTTPSKQPYASRHIFDQTSDLLKYSPRNSLQVGSKSSTGNGRVESAGNAYSFSAIPPSTSTEIVTGNDSEGSESHAASIYPAVARKTRKQTKRTGYLNPNTAASSASTSQSPLTNVGIGLPELLQQYDVSSEAELRELLKQRHQAEKDAAKEPEFLTEEEKGIATLEELALYWKKKDQARRLEKRPITRFDFRELGPLTSDIKQMPRTEIKNLLKRLRQEQWANDRRAQGIQVTHCEHCNQLTAGRHRCMVTKWKVAGSGPLKDRPLLLTQRPNTVILQTAPTPTTEQLKESYEYTKKHLEDRLHLQQLARPIEQDALDPLQGAPNITTGSQQSTSLSTLPVQALLAVPSVRISTTPTPRPGNVRQQTNSFRGSPCQSGQPESSSSTSN